MIALFLLMMHAFAKSFGCESFIADIDALFAACFFELIVEPLIVLGVVISRS